MELGTELQEPKPLRGYKRLLTPAEEASIAAQTRRIRKRGHAVRQGLAKPRGRPKQAANPLKLKKDNDAATRDNWQTIPEKPTRGTKRGCLPSTQTPRGVSTKQRRLGELANNEILCISDDENNQTPEHKFQKTSRSSNEDWDPGGSRLERNSACTVNALVQL